MKYQKALGDPATKSGKAVLDATYQEFTLGTRDLGSVVDAHLDLVKNHNVILLSLFFDSHPYDGENWNYDKLKFWLKDQPSNLIIEDISSLEEIFEFAFNEYFTDEDEQKWSDLEDYYYNTRYEYQLKLERDKIENEIEDEFLDNCGFFSKNMAPDFVAGSPKAF